MARLRTAGHGGRAGPANFAGYLVISASFGFAAGGMLAAGLLVADSFGLRALMASTEHTLATMAVFTLGLGALLSPLSLATGLALNPPDTRRAPPGGKRGCGIRSRALRAVQQR